MSLLANKIFTKPAQLAFLLLIAGVLLLLPACRPSSPRQGAAAHSSPDELFGELFDTVQMGRVFPDSKTFADCTPKSPAAEILRRYQAAKKNPGFDLKAFVLDNFELPVAHGSQFKSDTSRSAAEHINALWEVLTRPADDSLQRGSLLPLPKPYVVPGGRFGEIYYWDSYFTMLGLESAGRRDLIDNMTANFAYLIDTYGHIPNGNRTYYLGRSQPPFFSLIVKLSSGGPDAYLAQLEKEYQFWMDGADGLDADKPAFRRVLRLPDGTLLNRYWDDRPAPRPEAYREDVETAHAATGRAPETVYRNIRAAAESGWDFSSRWNAGNDLTGINTTNIAPVDLNCLMWHLEKTLQDAYTRQKAYDKAQAMRQRAEGRAQAVRNLFYEPALNWFTDYNFVDQRRTTVLSLAGAFPLYFQLADQTQADACAATLEKTFLRPGGLVSTPNRTGQQWDAPNGWAPLQWIAIGGLRHYQHDALADTVSHRWIDLCTRVYKRTGKMLEKYNVEDMSLEAGGGEYPVQDGFGWTNGVLLRLLKGR